MNVITTLEAESVSEGYYHILNATETGSVCGAIKIEDSLFGSHANEILSRTEAEQRDLQPCTRCLTYTGDQ